MNKKEILGLCELLKLHGYENTDNISKFIFGLQQENKQLKAQIEENKKALDENKKIINTILNFSFFKEECPLNFSFEDNSKEDEAQNIFYNDEYCENNCNDIYKDCWLKYFKELQKAKGDVKNEN